MNKIEKLIKEDVYIRMLNKNHLLFLLQYFLLCDSILKKLVFYFKIKNIKKKHFLKFNSYK